MIPSLALGALLLAGPAEPPSFTGRQAGPAVVSLAVDDCPDVPRDRLAHLLGLELEANVLAPEKADAGAVRVQVACAGTTVRVAVEDPATGNQLRRAAVFPSEQEDVRVRLVALAIAELVLTSRVAPSSERPPPAAVPELARPAPPPSPPPPGPPTEDARPQGHAYVLALGQALGPFSGVGLSWGGGLRIGWAFGRRGSERRSVKLAPAIDVELAAAETSADRALGTVQVSLWSATLRGTLRVHAGRAWLDVGGGGRFGLAQLQGQPADPNAVRGGAAAGTWAGPVAYVGIGARFAHVVVALGVEGGRVARAVSGVVDSGAPVSVDGNWACGTVAAGWGD
jgi:hypothetical protein